MQREISWRQKKTEAKDRKKKEKILNGYLRFLHPQRFQDEKNMSDYSDQTEGIVKIVRDSRKESEEELHTMQEQHNANHALYYFNMIADGLIDGRSTGNDCRKMARAREHMMNLREFIGDEKVELKRVIEMLLRKIEEFCPAQRKQLGFFLLEHWPLMRSFAEVYVKKEQRCLTDEQLAKLKDVLSGHCYLRLWWWKSRSRKLRMKIIGFIKEVTRGEKMSTLDALENPEKRYRAWVNNKVSVLFLTIQRNTPKDANSLLKHEFFLEEIEHHFVDSHAGYRVWRAFHYLKRYLKDYPHSKPNHQKGALKMLGLIYGHLGFDGRRILSAV